MLETISHRCSVIKSFAEVVSVEQAQRGSAVDAEVK